MLRDIPQVTKNLLILNVLMFILTYFFQTKGIQLNDLLGAHYVNSPLFKPYQVITYFFMHGGIMHIFFNMFALVMFGGFLEKLWGPKRFFILYVAAAIGAFALYNAIGVFEIMSLRKQLGPELSAIGMDLHHIDGLLMEGKYYPNVSEALDKYSIMCLTPMVGASGAIFGIMAAFAILFPNTELMLLFPPIPIKAKYLIGGYFVYELYRSIYQVEGDNVAHLAHVGGAVVGAILVLVWRRNRNQFY